MSAFIITRIQVGDYDTWRGMFDHDRPGAREKAIVQRVFRRVDVDDVGEQFQAIRSLIRDQDAKVVNAVQVLPSVAEREDEKVRRRGDAACCLVCVSRRSQNRSKYHNSAPVRQNRCYVVLEARLALAL